jgi:hypothetical protein
MRERLSMVLLPFSFCWLRLKILMKRRHRGSVNLKIVSPHQFATLLKL